MNDKAALNAVIAEVMRQVQARRYDDAIRQLRSAGDALRRHPAVRNLEGGILLEQGKVEEALGAFDRVVMAAGTFPEAHCNRGVALQRLGRLPAALTAFDTAIELRANYPMAQFNRANVLKMLGRFDEAISAYGQVLQQAPEFAEAYTNRGLIALRFRRFTEALRDAERALRLRPGQHEAAVLKAGALAELGRPDEALAALEGVPENVSEQVARAAALRSLGRYDEALAAADRAVALDPARPAAHSTRGVVLGDLFRLEEQLDAFQRAIQLEPDDARHRHSLAVALSEAGRVVEARAAYDEATRRAPRDSVMHYHASLMSLFLGDFENGFAEHEWRLKSPDYTGTQFLSMAPAWRGEDIDGKTILLFPEQGIGDSIQFLRYLPLIAERGGKVRLLLQKPLCGLAALSFPEIPVSTDAKDFVPVDFQAPLFSLAHAFETRLDSVPVPIPYLAADPGRVVSWRERLGDGGFRIGIAWQGNPILPNDRFRSVDPSVFAPLAALPGVRLISLQALHGLDKLATLPEGLTIESFGDEIGNNPDGFMEIAAMMQSLDLVVSVDSATAHLAGALGRPVWTAIRKQPEWRWMADRTDTPWYPTMRLFRQTEILSWRPVFEEMARALGPLVAAKRG